MVKTVRSSILFFFPFFATIAAITKVLGIKTIGYKDKKLL